MTLPGTPSSTSNTSGRHTGTTLRTSTCRCCGGAGCSNASLARWRIWAGAPAARVLLCEQAWRPGGHVACEALQGAKHCGDVLAGGRVVHVNDLHRQAIVFFGEIAMTARQSTVVCVESGRCCEEERNHPGQETRYICEEHDKLVTTRKQRTHSLITMNKACDQSTEAPMPTHQPCVQTGSCSVLRCLQGLLTDPDCAEDLCHEIL